MIAGLRAELPQNRWETAQTRDLQLGEGVI